MNKYSKNQKITNYLIKFKKSWSGSASLLLALCLLASSSLGPVVYAQTLSTSDANSILGDTTFYDPNACVSSVSGGNSDLFALGDSILERSRASGNLVSELQKNGYTNISIDAIVGRSINGAGMTTNGNPPSSALDSVNANYDKISSAGTILVVLGTNPDSYDTAIPTMMKIIRNDNPDARIFWVNVGVTLPRLKSSMDSANSAIDANATKYNYSVINWHQAVLDDPSLVPLPDRSGDDGYHPSVPKGIDKLVSLIKSTLGDYTGGSTGTGSGLAPVTGTTQQAKFAAVVWNYLRSQGLSEEQTAGILGNLDAESGIIPSRVQTNNPDGYSDVLKPEYLGHVGYGIAQWTTVLRQTGLINLARSKSVKDSDINMQAEYLWQELNGFDKGVLDALKKTTTIRAAAVEILLHYEIAGDTGKRMQDYRTSLAQKWYHLFANGSTAPTNDCVNGSSSSGVVAGDIVQTALNLAWPYHKTGNYGTGMNAPDGPSETAAKPEYVAAEQKYNKSSRGSVYSDCGVFVSTVILASGADSTYIPRGASAQEAHIKSEISGGNSSWEKEPNQGNTSNLLPGDILINSGHTYIFVGGAGNGYAVRQASWGTETPNSLTDAFDISSYNIYRIIK
ncbi:MAG TPA: phage tail tip lysozyme [Patescibacteria group bacterium]|nr:phage tail tip lysozyme [Patescibacteria group bacterium]